MKKALAALSALGLLGASGFVAWSVLSRPDDQYITSETVKSFNLTTGPVAVNSAPVRRSEEMRDAVASPVSPRPIPLSEMAAAPRAAAKAAPGPKPFLTPRLEAGVRKAKIWLTLMRKPSSLMGTDTALKNPRSLRAFLADPKAVDRYMNSTLVRVVLNSPAVAKTLLGSPAVVRAFLATPAMHDSAAVRDLLSSRMFAKMLDCPGVQEAIADPKVIRNMVADPETIRWLGENPQAMNAIASAAPALANAVSASAR